MKKILALSVLLWAGWLGLANAADNQVTITTGSGVTMRTTDVGAGVQSSNVILSSTSGGGTAIYGTAGTANANVLSIQGIASGTAVNVTATGLAQGSTTSGQTGSLILGAVTTAAPSYTTAQTSPISLTTAGDVRTIFSNTTIAVTNTGTFATQAAQATAANLNATVVGTGTFAVQAAATQSGTWTVGQTSPYPATATPYTASATGTTGATTATLAGASSVTTYLCGFSIRANATAAATNNATVTGVITATLNFTQWTAPLASGLGITEMIFVPCIPASGTNQSVAVVSGAPGSGGTVSVTAWGYKL